MIATDDAVRPVKPKAPRPIPENIPVQLRELPQWVNWRYEFRDDDWTKVPCIPRTGANAKSNDPSTWATFDEASRHAQRFDGFGFQFGDSGFVGIDLDDCRDPLTGKLTLFAEEIVERFNTYAEVSPSGEGVKLFLRGTWEGTGKNKLVNGTDRIEVYPRGRYFTVTGAKLPGARTRFGSANRNSTPSGRSTSRIQSPRTAAMVIRMASCAGTTAAASLSGHGNTSPRWIPPSLASVGTTAHSMLLARYCWGSG